MKAVIAVDFPFYYCDVCASSFSKRTQHRCTKVDADGTYTRIITWSKDSAVQDVTVKTGVASHRGHVHMSKSAYETRCGRDKWDVAVKRVVDFLFQL